MTTHLRSPRVSALLAVAVGVSVPGLLGGCSGSGGGGTVVSGLWPVLVTVGTAQPDSSHGLLVDPSHAVGLPNGDIAVTEMATGKDHVVIYDSNGKFLQNVGSSGSGPGQFLAAEGLAADAAGNLYIADTRNQRVEVFDSTFNFVRSFGSNAIFQDPESVAVDASGNCYVVDDLLNKVFVFDSTGTLVNSMPGPAPAIQLQNPLDAELDGKGHVVVADGNDNRVVFYALNGTSVSTLGSAGTQPGQFNNPIAVTFDSTGHLFVYDAGNSRIEEFGTSSVPIAIYKVKNPGIVGSLEGYGMSIMPNGNLIFVSGRTVEVITPAPFP